MPPIPVYTNAPIHPIGVTPETAAPEAQASSPTRTTNPPPTTTTTASVESPGPPPPQPGARPVAPTASLHSRSNSSSKYIPQPQPGAVPSASPATPTATATINSTTTLQQPPLPPPQLSMPAPTSNYASTHSTTAASPTHQGPTTLPLGPVASPTEAGTDQRHSIEHPPGYVQNPYAADGTAEQRARYAMVAEQERGSGGFGALGVGGGLPGVGGGNCGGGLGEGGGGGFDDNGVWEGLKKGLGQVGAYAQKMEEEAWKLAKGKEK
ncbi:hypothetical protein K402DRAFT_455219 [Aulographum hederae CBS 113979]|uniref:Uncharacterized protein n=1 Tax=Aulographum hederae CBS 113979 TaxID=1176131 RepID=A0A6G1GWA7_9PEZI|nr:hypothetical protein K402DRAFT_455219 [Aulographum hederae CBS 113979]